MPSVRDLSEMSFGRVTATNLAMIQVTNRKIWYEGRS